MPGIAAATAGVLANANADHGSVTNTYQLIGKFLTLRPDEVGTTPRLSGIERVSVYRLLVLCMVSWVADQPFLFFKVPPR